MVRKENLVSKLESISKYFVHLEKYRSVPFQEIRNDPDRLAAAERFLYLLAQSAIDMAEMLVKLHTLGKPETMSQAFEQLFENGYIEEREARSMIEMVGFRNALSHGYESFNYAVMERVLSEHVDDVAKFARIVREKEGLE
jgi:uncharacterized protein YutE (UPF0331/DUF86 family)